MSDYLCFSEFFYSLILEKSEFKQKGFGLFCGIVRVNLDAENAL